MASSKNIAYQTFGKYLTDDIIVKLQPNPTLTQLRLVDFTFPP